MHSPLQPPEMPPEIPPEMPPERGGKTGVPKKIKGRFSVGENTEEIRQLIKEWNQFDGTDEKQIEAYKKTFNRRLRSSKKQSSKLDMIAIYRNFARRLGIIPVEGEKTDDLIDKIIRKKIDNVNPYYVGGGVHKDKKRRTKKRKLSNRRIRRTTRSRKNVSRKQRRTRTRRR